MALPRYKIGDVKRSPQIFRRTGKLLGNLLKEFLAFRAVMAVTEKEQ